MNLLRWATLMFLALVSASSVFAAPQLTATLEPSEIRPGSYTTLSITIEGGQPDSLSALSLPAGVELASASPSFSNQTNIINGNIQRSAVITWQLMSSLPGEYVIPPQAIHIEGVPYDTNSTRLIVKENASGAPSSQFDPLMTLETEKREFYVGEVVPITVNVYVHRRTLLRRVGLIEMPKDNFAIQRFPLQAEENTVTMGGIPYRALAFQSTLSALQPGKYKLGPATSELILDVPMSNDRTTHPFFAQSESRKVKPVCNEIDVTVLALPTEGRPKNFNGVVGEFEMSMTADPQELAVGDPISVEISITGIGNFDSLTPPVITDPDPWKSYPAKRYRMSSSNVPVPHGEPQSIGFNQVIVPKSHATFIPPFEFSYFSPSKKQYVTLRTKPTPIKVTTAARTPQETNATTNGTTSGAPAPALEKAPEVKSIITDILVPLPKDPVWLAMKPTLLKNKTFITVNIITLGVLLALILGKLVYTSWLQYVHSPEAPVRELLGELHSSKTNAEFYALAARYIEVRKLTGDNIQSIMERHDALNYGGVTQDEATAKLNSTERKQVLAALKV
ncbi:hypothetical protein BH11VER1_BH11VER1_18630 [soil metagenome]